jgi:hypothetical protein
MLPNRDDLWFTSMLSEPSSDGIHPRRTQWNEHKDLPEPLSVYEMEWDIPPADVTNTKFEPPKSPQLASSPALTRPNLNQILSILRPPAEKRPRTRTTTHGGKRVPRPRFGPYQTEILIHWLDANAAHPYPKPDEMDSLRNQTGLERRQIMTWLVNNRSRMLRKGEKVRKPFQNRLNPLADS